MRKRKWWLFIPLLLVVGYLLGPRPASSEYTTDLPAIPGDTASLSQFILQKEASHRVKPDNQARIMWANDSTRQKNGIFNRVPARIFRVTG